MTILFLMVWVASVIVAFSLIQHAFRHLQREGGMEAHTMAYGVLILLLGLIWITQVYELKLNGAF